MITARRQRRMVVPIDLGGSPTSCLVRPPLRAPPTAELVGAMVEHYQRERSRFAGIPVEVAFFHGGRPARDLVEAARPHPLRLSCSPADIERADIEALIAAGLETVEVEVLTFDDQVLRRCGRGYGSARADALVRGLRELGLRVGVVLMPGLPGSSHAGAVRDARRVTGLDDRRLKVDLVRILPALALAGSGLAERAATGQWRPMSLGEAVTTSVAMVDLLERAEVRVARLGLQPGADVPVGATAGPAHPNLRALVEVRRFRRRMEQALRGARPGSRPILRVHPKDLSWAKGTANENVRALRARLRLDSLLLLPDPGLPRGTVARAAAPSAQAALGPAAS